jgi:hypothetical protein
MERKKTKIFLALNFRLAVNMLQLIYALKKHKNWRFPTPSQPRITFESEIQKLGRNKRKGRQKIRLLFLKKKENKKEKKMDLSVAEIMKL